MNCVSDGMLRTYFDGELDSAELASVVKHLSDCSTCRAHAEKLSAASLRVTEHLGSLEGAPRSNSEESPQIALARFKANLRDEFTPASFFARITTRWRLAWAACLAAAILLGSLAFPSARSFAQKLLATLRIEKVQTVTLDFSAFDGPQNRNLQQALGQMISENVVVTTNEKALPASSTEDATSLAGFPVRLPSARTDTPQFHVEGAHAFHMTVDRSRLQDILDQAGRTDLILPATLDGAPVSVQIPRSVQVGYGNCPHSRESAQGQQPDTNSPTTPVDCVFLVQAPSPIVSVPADLNLQQLAETALQLFGMSTVQARQFCQTIDWRSTLVLPLPPSVHSYETVDVDGVQGTLMNTTNHRGSGPTYVLVWVKGSIIYALLGSGDSASAVQLANSLK
jgi:hypothetical protein